VTDKPAKKRLPDLLWMVFAALILPVLVIIYLSIRETGDNETIENWEIALGLLYFANLLFAGIMLRSMKIMREGRDLLKKQTDELEEKRAKDQALLSSIGEGIVVTDRNGNVEMINKQAEMMVGWKNEEVMGKKWFEVAPLVDEKGNSIPPERRATQKVLVTGQPIASSTNYYVRRDGSKFSVGTTAAPVVLNGKTIGVIAVFRDITREREIDRAKTEFVSLASHQLRTPLSAIKWYTEMLSGGDAGQLNPEQKEFVQCLYQSNERMIELVNSLLNISRIESGRIKIDPVPTDLGELVNQIMKELQPKIIEKKINMVVSVHPELPQIKIDPKLIRQVYLNLISNAIKYTPANGEISVFISRKEDEIISQVTDNGCGIPKADYGRMFERFFRAENAQRADADGTGLGLYLVKAIIDSSKGKIWFASEENKGTTFWFSLPVSGTPPKKGEVTLDS
jgi:PAS domain S-box-containing protein